MSKTMGRLCCASLCIWFAGAAELKYAVIVTRHGVRSPTRTAAQLAPYAVEPWPDWGVPPGYLTPRGRTLMKQFGSYYRAYFSSLGALAEGMHPGCAAAVHSAPEGEIDPLFGPTAAGLGKPDRNLAAAAVTGRIGSNPQELLNLYRPAFEELERILTGCVPGATCARLPAPGQAPPQ